MSIPKINHDKKDECEKCKNMTFIVSTYYTQEGFFLQITCTKCGYKEEIEIPANVTTC